MLYNCPVIRPGNRTPSYTLFPTGAGQEFATCVSRFTVLRGKSHEASSHVCAHSWLPVSSLQEKLSRFLWRWCCQWRKSSRPFCAAHEVFTTPVSICSHCRALPGLVKRVVPAVQCFPLLPQPHPSKILLVCVIFNISSHLILRLFSSEDTAPWPQACQSISFSCDLY